MIPMVCLLSADCFWQAAASAFYTFQDKEQLRHCLYNGSLAVLIEQYAC